MVLLVVALNSLIGLGCLFVAWRVWQLRQTLAAIADTLIAAERNTHRVLHNAPEAIMSGQIGVYQLRQQTRQLAQMRQLFALVSVGQSLWQWRSPSKRSKNRATPLSRRNPKQR